MDNLPASTTNDASAIMQVITRSATDASIDPAKIAQMYELYARVKEDQAKQDFAAAMSDCQAEMLPVSQDQKNPQTHSKYASYVGLDAALRPIYTKHGFGVSFDTAESEKPDHVRVVAQVSHRNGFTSVRRLDMPCDGKGAKGGDVMTKTHAVMSAVSYARRGLLKMIFNIAEGDHDDDGNAAGGYGGGRITPEQVEQLDALFARFADPAKKKAGFLEKIAKVAALEDIPAGDFARYKTTIERSLAQESGK